MFGAEVDLMAASIIRLPLIIEVVAMMMFLGPALISMVLPEKSMLPTIFFLCDKSESCDFGVCDTSEKEDYNCLLLMTAI
jgi:hypothetical protein